MTFQEATRVVASYTTLSLSRLRGLWDAVRLVETAGVPGDLVECGCYKGGSAAMLGLARTTGRTLWLFDSFAGMPEPAEEDPPEAAEKVGTSSCPAKAVRANLSACGVGDPIQLVPGWYKDTLPWPELKQIAVLHIDCDWYESVRKCLDALYHNLSPGAVVQVDDYGHWAGACKAVDDWLKAWQPNTELKVLDYTGRQFRIRGSME